MLARRARTSKSWDHVFNFRTCDVAVSSLITFNRADASTCATRRRAFGAVGPSRTNLQTYSEDGNGWNVEGGTPPTVTAATTYLSQTCAKLAFASTVTPGYANSRAQRTSVVFPIVTGTTYSTACFVALSRALVGTEIIYILVTGDTAVGQIAITADNCAANVGRFSRILVPSGVALADGINYFIVYPGATLTADLDVYVTKLSAEVGSRHTPYIPTTSAPVTTTDWPRTNYIAKSNKFSSALWGRNATGTGVPPAVVSEVVPSPSGSLDATRITFDLGAGDTLGDQSSLNLYQDFGLIPGANYCAGIWAKIPVGVTLAVRTVGASGYLALVGTGQWKRYPRPEVAGSTYAYLDICLRGGLGIGASTGRVTVDLWHCTLEEGSALTATIPNDTAAPLTVNTPPAGQMTTVAANVPQLEYDKDGIGRGLRVDGAATQLLSTTKGFKGGWHNNGPMTGWVDNYGVAPDGTVSTTFASAPSTAYELVSATIGVPLKFSVHVRTGTAPYYRLYADGVPVGGSAYIDRTFGTNAVVGTFGPVTASGVDGDAVDGMQRVWFEVTPTATGILEFHIYPISGTAEFWGANVTTGNLTGYIEGQHTRAAASALMVPSAVGLTPTSGTLLIDCEVGNTSSVLWQLGSSGDNTLHLARDGNTLRVWCNRAGVAELANVVVGTPFTTSNRARVAVAWSSGRIYVVVNGDEPNIFNASVPTSFADLSVGYYPYGGGYHIDGVIAEVRTASRTLTIAELVRESAL